MTLQEINSKYSYQELHAEGNGDLRRELFLPILTDLYENKIIYYERFACVAIIENIEITPEWFKAKAVPYLKLKAGGSQVQYYPDKPWIFGARWDATRLLNDHFAGYGTWLIWTDKELVKTVEELALKGELETAMELSIFNHK